MRALYDLGWRLASFNFFEWLVQAKASGADTVVFDIRHMRTRKWSEEYTRRRFASICEPGPALAGMRCEMLESNERVPDPVNGAGGAPLVAFWRKHGSVPRLKTVKPAGSERYTVTLRNTQRAPQRNSDEPVWRAFAEEIGARVIPDYDREPMHLHDRMALYAGAEMNFFCSNGPAVLCTLTEYPCMLFNTNQAAGSLSADGLPGWGAQYPWMLGNQRAIWEDASAESLRAHFYYWKRTGEFLERFGSPAEA